jgi:hypothetical protein
MASGRIGWCRIGEWRRATFSQTGESSVSGTPSFIAGSCLNQSSSLAVSYVSYFVRIGMKQHKNYLLLWISYNIKIASTVPIIKLYWPVTVWLKVFNFLRPLVRVFLGVDILNFLCGVRVLSHRILSTAYFQFQLQFCVNVWLMKF